ncbi:MAG: radical SAM protein [Candidatus Omnitrophota bacterium]|jgi:MoaA/NifB/PqqE/SkfB family radical SAM enzyme
MSAGSLQQKEQDDLFDEVKRNYRFYFSRVANFPLVPPDTIQIMLTSRCNLRCSMCGVWKSGYKQEEEIGTEDVKSLIDQALELGVKTVYFTGGEALLREDLFELIEYAARDGIITTFNTNGTLVTEPVAERIANSGLRSLTFSIDSPREKVHDSLRGEGVFRKAMAAIEMINRYKKTTGRPDLVLCGVAMRQNAADLDGLVRLADANGFCYVALQPVVDNSGLWLQENKHCGEFWIGEESLPDLRRSLDRIEDFKRSKRMPVVDVMGSKMISYFRGEWRVNSCYAGFSRIFVNPLGDISFVCFESFGNIRRDKLKDAWYGQAAGGIREKIKNCGLNCTQFCSERPESESPQIIHDRFLSGIAERFDEHIRLDLLKKEYDLLDEFEEFCRQDKKLEETLADLRRAANNTIEKSLTEAACNDEAPVVTASLFKSPSGARFSQFYLAITNRCNLSCIMCSTTRHPHEVEEELSLKDWLAVLENITRFDTEVVTFGGGEPLLRQQDLAEMIKFCAGRGMMVNVVTNGTLMNPDFLAGLSSFRNKLVFLVSCDGMRRENDLIRGEGTFHKILAAADLLRRQGFTFYFTSVIMPENFARYTDFLKFLRRYYPGVRLDIQPVIPHNEIYHRRQDFELNDRQKAQLKDIISFLRRENPVPLCRPLEIIDRYVDYFNGTLKTENRCKMGSGSFNINLRGNIWICGKELEYPLYSNKLEDVLNSGEYRQEMRRVEACDSPCLAGLVI